MNISEEFYELRHKFLTYGIAVRDLRPFDVTEFEVREIMADYACSDAVMLRPGDDFDFMGIKCVVVPVQPEREPNGD